MIAPLGVVVPLVAGLCVQTHPCSARADCGARRRGMASPLQGITALARSKQHQDARLDMERKAKNLLDRVA